MTSRSADREPEAESYEPPEVEEVDTDAGPAVTAAGDSPYGAITLIEDDDE